MKVTRRLQGGATLVIGMIMLVLVTLFVLAAINMSTTNLRIMGNEQARNDAIAAGQQAIEAVVTKDFTTDPAAAAAAAPTSIDVKGDKTAVYATTVATPTCLNSVPVKVTELSTDSSSPDKYCFFSSTASAPGVVGSGGTGSGNSLCSSTQWEVNVTVTDTANNSGTNVKLHQGVGKRVATGDAVC